MLVVVDSKVFVRVVAGDEVLVSVAFGTGLEDLTGWRCQEEVRRTASVYFEVVLVSLRCQVERFESRY